MLLYTKHTGRFGDFYKLPDGTNIQTYTNDTRWPKLKADIESGAVEVQDYEDSEEYKAQKILDDIEAQKILES